MHMQPTVVLAGLVPAIHVTETVLPGSGDAWMPGPSPGKTTVGWSDASTTQPRFVPRTVLREGAPGLRRHRSVAIETRGQGRNAATVAPDLRLRGGDDDPL